MLERRSRGWVWCRSLPSRSPPQPTLNPHTGRRAPVLEPPARVAQPAAERGHAGEPVPGRPCPCIDARGHAGQAWWFALALLPVLRCAPAGTKTHAWGTACILPHLTPSPLPPQVNLVLTNPDTSLADVERQLAGPPSIEGLPVVDATGTVRARAQPLLSWPRRAALASRPPATPPPARHRNRRAACPRSWWAWCPKRT